MIAIYAESCSLIEKHLNKKTTFRKKKFKKSEVIPVTGCGGLWAVRCRGSHIV
jgi:hypothetical protein